MKYTIIDVETDGLLETVTKIHCLSYNIIESGKSINKGSISKYEEIKEFLKKQTCLVGHNIIRYDLPVIEKILNITLSCNLIDTLGLSWYLYPMRPKHGLEGWGDELGVPKPVINDWKNLSLKDYIHRCESDVEINVLLLNKQLAYLTVIYEGDEAQISNLIHYLGFKLDCAREQEEVKCKVDVELVTKSLSELEGLKEKKVNSLITAMPRDIKFKEISKPSKMKKQDGNISVKGSRWYDLLSENHLPLDYEETVMVEVANKPGNPSSHIQLKNWLFSLGWKPITFEHRKNSAGEVRPIPQIYNEDEVCQSIKDLYSVEPALKNLNMLSLINHRIGVFKSYLATTNEQGYTVAQMNGFTNTLRIRHRKPIANLPSIYKFYGKQIRGAIIAPNEESTLCGSDMSSLEDTTKQHYMYFFDPDYVTQMRVPGFDPHLDIGVLSGMLTEEQSESHKNKTEDYSNIRKKAKVVNFAGIYGAGPSKIALTSGMSLKEAKKLHKIYWERNKSVKLVEKSCQVKTIGKQMWLKQPISEFWYSLRYMKDRFSTLNQGRICSE